MADRNLSSRSITGLEPVQDVMCDRLGNSHHKRCGAIDWHTGPTPDWCSAGAQGNPGAPLDDDKGNLNTTRAHEVFGHGNVALPSTSTIGDVTLVERISSAEGIETLVELPCRTSGETTRQ